jgi:hypothetical protein
MILDRTHSSEPSVAMSMVRIRVNMINVDVLLLGTTRPET